MYHGIGRVRLGFGDDFGVGAVRGFGVLCGLWSLGREFRNANVSY
jgi:hypothetical protein